MFELVAGAATGAAGRAARRIRVRSASAPSAGPLVDDALQLLVTPAADHQAFVAAIDAATASVDMAMFHLTDDAVVASLVRAAGRGVAVRVILDRGGLRGKGGARVAATLRDGGVDVRAASPAFSITHEKAMVVDRALAFITAINLTKDVANTRDFGIETRAPGIVADVETLFAADWDNAATGGHATPALAEPSLVVSPTTSQARLVALIDRAHTDAIVTVENLGSHAIADALAAAAARGVAVRLVVPLCDKNSDPAHDYPPAVALAARGVTVRMMPAPESPEHPYMHSKMIQIDGGAATYVGSVNFSENSIARARELGVIFSNRAAAAQIASTFDADWAVSVAPPADPPRCKE